MRCCSCERGSTHTLTALLKADSHLCGHFIECLSRSLVVRPGIMFRSLTVNTNQLNPLPVLLAGGRIIFSHIQPVRCCHTKSLPRHSYEHLRIDDFFCCIADIVHRSRPGHLILCFQLLGCRFQQGGCSACR